MKHATSPTKPCPSAFDLPEEFVRHYRPVRAHPNQRGAAAYLFNRDELAFYCRLVTGSKVVPEAIWSIQMSDETAVVFSGECREAAGFLVTDVARPPSFQSSYPLDRRLTYSQKRRQATLRGLLRELEKNSFQTAADMLAFVNAYANAA